MATLENYCSLEVNLVITVPRSHPGSTGPLSWVKAFTTSLRSHLQQDSSSPDSDQQVAPLIYVSPLSPPRFWGQAARQAACRVDELEHAVGLLPTLERPMRDFRGGGWLSTRGRDFSAFPKRLFCPPSAEDPTPGADEGGMKEVML